jgi:hypothetical protein
MELAEQLPEPDALRSGVCHCTVLSLRAGP